MAYESIYNVLFFLSNSGYLTSNLCNLQSGWLTGDDVYEEMSAGIIKTAAPHLMIAVRALR